MKSSGPKGSPSRPPTRERSPTTSKETAKRKNFAKEAMGVDPGFPRNPRPLSPLALSGGPRRGHHLHAAGHDRTRHRPRRAVRADHGSAFRSEEHTSEL